MMSASTIDVRAGSTGYQRTLSIRAITGTDECSEGK